MTGLLATARERWGAWDVGTRPPHSTVLLAMKREAAKATTAFLLDDRGEVVAVAKAARSGPGDAVLEKEAAAARSWHRNDWPLVRSSCPRVLDLTGDPGGRVLWLSAVPGTSMLVSYLGAGHLRRRGAVTADFARAAAWLDALQEQSQGERYSLDELQQLMDGTFAAYGGQDPAVQELFADARTALAASCPDGVVSTAVHGDFWMGNLLVAQGRVTGVVDLELSVERGLPMTDVLKLPLSYALYLDTAGRCRPRPGTWAHLVGFEEVFLGTGHLARAAAAFVHGRMQRLGLEPASLRAFLPLVLAQQAVLQRHDPVAADGYAQLLGVLARGRRTSWVWSPA
ncbi:MAG: hypothetical protein JWN87_1831 [Frankiales bacterium]|nr:hypothetical protein [Frankiales bacterium]